MEKIPNSFFCSPAIARARIRITATIIFALLLALSLSNGAGGTRAWAADPFAEARQRMIVRDLQGRDIHDPRVLAAMAQVPRHLFVAPHLASRAYEDYPLPTRHGQTISQPYIVALMTQWAEIQPNQRVLEIGTGSGYQAAVLASLTDQVFTIELDSELAETAAELLKKLGYQKVKVKCGDGYQGWPEQAPFEAILVTAAAPEVPPALKQQLKEGGRLVIPVGPPNGVQTLLRLTKQGNGFKTEDISPVRFVPLIQPEKVR